MTPEANIVTRAAIDQAAGAVQDLVRAFMLDRSPAAVRNDLMQGRDRLKAALKNVSAAIHLMT